MHAARPYCRLDGQLHSYVVVTPELGPAQAHAAEAEIAVGGLRGPLHGVPIGLKDLFWVKDTATTAGMVIHRDFRPYVDGTQSSSFLGLFHTQALIG